MTVGQVRIHFSARRLRLTRYLAATHGGFAEWFPRRLKPIREQLRGPEAAGVPMVSFFLDEDDRGWPSFADEWRRLDNMFAFRVVVPLEPLRDTPPVVNIERLMGFMGAIAAQAPWPQVRAAGAALSAPLTDDDRASLVPYLTWPREVMLRKMGYADDRLEFMMAELRRRFRGSMREARWR